MPTQAEIKTSVVSRDGTQIVYWTSGCGPPLVLVQGAPADHTRWRPLLPTWNRTWLFMHSTGEAEVPALTLRRTAWNGIEQDTWTKEGWPSRGMWPTC
jgi:hypothetical protein